MELYEKVTDIWFWMSVPMAILSLATVIVRINHNLARHGNPIILMSLCTELLAVVGIFVSHARLSSGFRELSQTNKGVRIQRLQLAAFVMALLAYSAIGTIR